MLFLFVLIVLQHMAMSKIQTDCPQTKKVGDTCYTLMEMTSTQKYGCMEDCTYRKTVEPENGNLYCFKAGPLPVTDCGFLNGTTQVTGRIRIDYELSKFHSDEKPEYFSPIMTTMCNSTKLCATDNKHILHLVGTYKSDVEPHTNDDEKCMDVNNNIMTTGIDKLSMLFREMNVKVLNDTELNCPADYHMLQLWINIDPVCTCTCSSCTGCLTGSICKDRGCPYNYCNSPQCTTCNGPDPIYTTDIPA